MKTLLLALVVVTFVCLDFGYSLICYSCTGPYCGILKKCYNGQNVCYRRRKVKDPIGFQTTRGCAVNCPTLGPNDIIKCCARNRCNL